MPVNRRPTFRQRFLNFSSKEGHGSNINIYRSGRICLWIVLFVAIGSNAFFFLFGGISIEIRDESGNDVAAKYESQTWTADLQEPPQGETCEAWLADADVSSLPKQRSFKEKPVRIHGSEDLILNPSPNKKKGLDGESVREEWCTVDCEFFTEVPRETNTYCDGDMLRDGVDECTYHVVSSLPLFSASSPSLPSPPAEKTRRRTLLAVKGEKKGEKVEKKGEKVEKKGEKKVAEKGENKGGAVGGGEGEDDDDEYDEEEEGGSGGAKAAAKERGGWSKGELNAGEARRKFNASQIVSVGTSLDSDVTIGLPSWGDFSFMDRPTPKDSSTPILALFNFKCETLPQKLEILHEIRRRGLGVDLIGFCLLGKGQKGQAGGEGGGGADGTGSNKDEKGVLSSSSSSSLMSFSATAIASQKIYTSFSSSFRSSSSPSFPFSAHPRMSRQEKREKLKIFSKYKFTMLFEVRLKEDVISDDFFLSLEAGVVPIVVSPHSAKKFAPADNAFLQMKRKEDLVTVIEWVKYLLNSDSSYRDLLRWKEDWPSDSFLSLLDLSTVNAPCRLCVNIATRIQKVSELSLRRPCRCWEEKSNSTVFHVFVRERGRIDFEPFFLRSNDLKVTALIRLVFHVFKKKRHKPIWMHRRPHSLASSPVMLRAFRIYPVEASQDAALQGFGAFRKDSQLRKFVENVPCPRLEVIFL